MLPKIPLACLIIAALLGCAPATQGAAISAASASPAAASQDLATFTATDAVLFRDGGSIEVTGQTAGGPAIILRYDGKMGSETRGQIAFATDGRQPLTRKQTEALIKSLNTQLLSPAVKIDRPVLETFIDHLLKYRDKPTTK